VIALIKFIFKDTEKNTELILPVTPPSFEVAHGINIETIKIHILGDVALAGYGTLSTFKIDCMFPVQKYSFSQASAEINPYTYVKQLNTVPTYKEEKYIGVSKQQAYLLTNIKLHKRTNCQWTNPS
jgi:hypothetical protein